MSVRTIHAFHKDLAAGQGGAAAALLRPPLWLASQVYRGMMAARNAAYDTGLLEVRRVPAPVISVGNISTGGTGKTPLVVELVHRLTALGRRPAVVSRGYKGADERRADELLLIERSIPPPAVCLASPDRVAGALRAIADHNADVIVLDDAFQHRRIGRDLDIVMVDATRPLEFDHVLPRGHLRESLHGLRRADLLIVTRADQVPSQALQRLTAGLENAAGDKPVLRCVHRALYLRLLEETAGPAEFPSGDPVYLVSGIANPDAFQHTASECGLDFRGHDRFGDHHAYAPADVAAACARAEACGARHLVVTEKDAVKLAALSVEWPLPVWILPVRIDFSPADSKIIDAKLSQVLKI